MIIKIFSYVIISILLIVIHLASVGTVNASQQQTFDSDQWLKNRFSVQHQNLQPVVAVADMYLGCQIRKNIPKSQLIGVKQSVTSTDRNVLAQKLVACLGEQSIKSDIAINDGLVGCFYEQFAGMKENERAEKMQEVQQALVELSKQERQKTLTQCVSEQAINYLK